MGVRIIRPQQKIYHIPGLGIQTIEALASGAAGWWVVAGKTCVAAYQPKGAASLAASYVNLANPGTYDAYAGVAPTWGAATGWGKSTGENWYLKTDLVVSTNTSWTFLVRFSNAASVSGNAFGLYGGAANKRLQLDVWSGAIDFGNGGLLAAGTGSSADQVAGFAGATAYVDGLPVGQIPTGDAHSNDIYIGAVNVLDAPNYYLGVGYLKILAIYSGTLSGAEVATVSNSMSLL